MIEIFVGKMILLNKKLVKYNCLYELAFGVLWIISVSIFFYLFYSYGELENEGLVLLFLFLIFYIFGIYLIFHGIKLIKKDIIGPLKSVDSYGYIIEKVERKTYKIYIVYDLKILVLKDNNNYEVYNTSIKTTNSKKDLYNPGLYLKVKYYKDYVYIEENIDKEMIPDSFSEYVNNKYWYLNKGRKGESNRKGRGGEVER